MICFTATIPEDKEEGTSVLERLTHLKFQIKKDFGFSQPNYEPEKISGTVQFLTRSKMRSAMIIFTTDSAVKDIKEQVESTNAYKVFEDCEDMGMIRDMKGKCLIVTKEELMRGVDYRLEE